MNITNLEKEYARTITALNRTGILPLLPRSENLGVIGIDGKEYPVPIQEQLLAPVGYWSRDAGRKMHLSAHRTGNRLRGWVARSTVRLGT